MRQAVECPKCGAVVKPPGYKPYCPSCGWNREIAGKYLRSEIRFGYAILAPIGMGALAAYIFTGPSFSLFDGWTMLFALSGGMFICAGGITVWNLRALNQLRATFPGSDRVLPRGPFRQFTSDKPTPFPGKYDFLRSLPRPRKVRTHGWVPAILEMHLWGTNENRLLAEGDLAFGWVVVQKKRFLFNASSYSERTYEFRDSSELLIMGKATDETDSFFEEMIIPVFYDPQNPRKHTVLTNLEEIVKPGD